MADKNCTTKFCKKCQCDTERDKRGACKPCVSARHAAWRAANQEKHKAYKAAWYASNPEKHKARTATWQAANPEKRKASDAAWRAANPDRYSANQTKWREANPEILRVHCQNRRAREREAGGNLSTGLAERLLKLQRGKCACGCKQPLGDDYHLDHIMPIALGGSNTDDNIQLLRATCNQQKHAKHPVDFMQSRGFLL